VKSTVPAGDETQTLLHLLFGELVFFRELVLGQSNEKPLDAELADLGLQGAARIEQGEHDRIMQTPAQPLEAAGDRPGRELHRFGDLSMRHTPQGKLDQHALALLQQRRALEHSAIGSLLLDVDRIHALGAFQHTVLDQMHGCFPQLKPNVQQPLNPTGKLAEC
jgi:hypothetical protein